MPQSSNKISQFWQELKRRKVVRVSTVYAATSFIIMEAGDIMLPRLGLPDWTVTFLIILLIVGFPITIILSWIFDVTPEGIKKTESIDEVVEQESTQSPIKRRLQVSDGIIAVLIVVVVILAYPKIFGSGKSIVAKDPDGKISITVLPFENLTGDSLYYDWQVGVQNLLIHSLSNSKEISVRQPRTMSNFLAGTENKNYTSITPSTGREIASKLETNTYILGNILKAGNKIRIGAQLRNTSTQEIYRSYEVDGDSEDQIFMMADSLSNLLMNFLEIKVIEKDAYVLAKSHSETNSAEAYKYYIQGLKMTYSSEFAEAIKLYNKALDSDSSFVSALVWLSVSYLNNKQPEQARLIQARTARYIDQAPLYEQLYYSFFKALFDKDLQELIKYGMRLTKEYPHEINTYYSFGWIYNHTYQYKKAADVFDQLFERMRQMDFEWSYITVYTVAGLCYHELGQHTKEQEVYEHGLRALPDDPMIIYRQAVCALSQGDSAEANKLIQKYKSIAEGKGLGSGINTLVKEGEIYEEGGYLDQSEEIFRHAFELAPQDIEVMHALALFLIRNEINVDEGIELINQAFETNQTNTDLLVKLHHLKGWGLYKQGKNREALEHLIKAWELRPFYDHENFLHIREVEQALASQNQ